MTVDVKDYIIGFKCFDEPESQVFKHVECYPQRLQIRYGRVKLDKDVWGTDEEVYLTLDTEESGATYYAFKDTSYGRSSLLWKRSLTVMQNPKLAQYMSWL
jgi:hypothetical protein